MYNDYVTITHKMKTKNEWHNLDGRCKSLLKFLHNIMCLKIYTVLNKMKKTCLKLYF